MQKIFVPPIFELIPNLKAGYTTRHLGADYPAVAELLSVPLESLQTLKQIHSNKVHWADAAIGREKIDGDALVAADDSLCIGVRVADCLPLLVYDPVSGLRAAIHAGWRGLVAGIIENSLNLMKEKGAAMQDCLVSLGPCICDQCFEVGPEVAKAFNDKFGSEAGIITQGNGDRSLISLKKAAQIIITSLGVLHSESLNICTRCQQDQWPSFRGGDQSLRTLAFLGKIPLTFETK